jgi:hypothetical protein
MFKKGCVVSDPRPFLLGDPGHWAVTAAGMASYLLAALGCLWLVMRRGWWQWLWPATALLVLMLDVRLCFWSMISDLGRDVASRFHEYATKAEWLSYATLGAVLAVVLAFTLLIWFVRRGGRGYSLAIVGVGVSVLAHTLMAISWHKTDVVLYRPIGPFMVVNLAWISGAILVLLGAFWAATAKSQRV